MLNWKDPVVTLPLLAFKVTNNWGSFRLKVQNEIKVQDDKFHSTYCMCSKTYLNYIGNGNASEQHASYIWVIWKTPWQVWSSKLLFDFLNKTVEITVVSCLFEIGVTKLDKCINMSTNMHTFGLMIPIPHSAILSYHWYFKFTLAWNNSWRPQSVWLFHVHYFETFSMEL